MDATNGFDAASAGATRGSGANAVPTPAELIVLTKRLRELGTKRATVENLAAKFGVRQATLEGWARREQPFGPEHAALAAQLEAALQGQIARLETEREEAASGTDDAVWEKMQKEQRERRDGRTSRNDPAELQERFDAALSRLDVQPPALRRSRVGLLRPTTACSTSTRTITGRWCCSRG